MAESFSKARLYEYGANSNLVLEAERGSHRQSPAVCKVGKSRAFEDNVSSITIPDRLKIKSLTWMQSCFDGVNCFSRVRLLSLLILLLCFPCYQALFIPPHSRYRVGKSLKMVETPKEPEMVEVECRLTAHSEHTITVPDCIMEQHHLAAIANAMCEATKLPIVLVDEHLYLGKHPRDFDTTIRFKLDGEPRPLEDYGIVFVIFIIYSVWFD